MSTTEILPVLLSAAVKSTVVLGLAAMGALWLRRGSAASRHLAWQLGLLGVLALPMVSWVVPEWRVLPALPALRVGQSKLAPTVTGERTQAMTPAPEELAQKATSLDINGSAERKSLAPAAGAVSAPDEEVLQGAVRSWPARALPWLVIVWAAGAAAVLGRFALGLTVAHWYTRRARPLDAVEWASMNETMSFAVGLGHPVRLLKSERAATPMTFGVLNPIVLLPRDADEWPEDRRRIVLLHELAHVHRLDSLTHIFANLACALYWFNPLVWITAARLRAEAERACDDWVLRAGMRASTYADHLLDMVRTIGRLHTPASALPMAQRSTFEGRLLAILEPGINRSGLTRGQGLLLTSLVALVIVPLAALTPSAASAYVDDGSIPIGVVRSPDAAQESGSALAGDERAAPAAAEDTGQAGARQLPLEPPTVQDTQRSKRGFLTNIAHSAVEAVLGRSTELGRVTTRAISDANIDKVVEDLSIQTLDTWLSGQHEFLQQGTGRRGRMSDAAIAALANALADDDVSVRRAAVHALGQQEDERGVAALSRALREDTDASVRQAAAWALGQIEDARAVPALSEALRRDDNVEVRRTAAWALGQIESASAVDALFDAMRDADREVRHQSVWALGQIEDVRAVPALARALSDDDVEIRRQAAWALGEIEDGAAIPALGQALRDTDTAVRQQAAWALGQIEDAAAVPVLAAALKDASTEVRRQAAWALGQIESRPAPAQLLEALSDTDVQVRRQAAWALGQIEDPNAVTALRAALKDTDAQVKQGALRALAAVGDEAAFEALAEMLKDPDPQVRRAAAQALGRGSFHWPQPQPQPQPQPRPRPHGW